MTESRSIRPQTADIVDMEHLLNGLSYSGNDFHANQKNYVIEELPQQESGTVRLTFGGSEQQLKNLMNDIQLEIPTMYPCPAASYNPKKCPPNLKEAERHGSAHQVAKVNPYNTVDEVCESTGLPVNRRKLALCCPTKKLSYLGPVFPMYFLYVKQLAILAFLLTCIGGYMIYDNRVRNVLDYQGLVLKMAQDSKQSLIFTVSIFVFILLGFILLYVFRRNQKATKMACKKTLVTPSDYSVMAYNMGRFHTEDEVKAFFSNYIVPGFALDVQKITVTYDIQKYVNKVRELKDLKAQKEIAEKNANYISSGDAERINDKIEEITKYFAQNKKLFVGCRGFKRNGLAFVTFSSKQEAKFVKRKFEFSLLERVMIWLLEKCTDEFPEYFFKDQYIKVEKAPELNEIIWENLNCYNSKVGATFLTFASSLTVIASVSFALVCFKEDLLKSLPDYEIYIRCFVIAVTNEILAAFNNSLVYNESFKTMTEMRIAIEKRIAIFQFINSALPILLINKYLLSSVETEIASISYSALIMIAMTSGLPILLRILNFSYISKRIQRQSVINKVKRNSSSCGITQEEANASHEYPEFDILRVYADNTRTLLLSCLFFAVSPGVAVVAFISFVLGHFVDKYNLLRRSLLPSSLRSEIAETMFEYLDFALFLLAFGVNFFIDLMEQESEEEQNLYSTVNLFATVLAVVYLLLPNKRLARSCFQRAKKVSWSDILLYLQAFEYFGEDYQGANIIARDDPDASRFKDLYKSTLNDFKQVETISELPEILPIFEYANKRPAISDLKKNGLTGLRNPYYVYPQNYGYGNDPARLSNTNLSTIKTPLLQNPHLDVSGGISPLALGAAKKEKQKVKSNELVPSSYGSISNSLENRSKLGGDHSVKGNSLLKDILMIPSFHSKSDGEFHFHVSSQKDEIISPNFGAMKQNDSAMNIVPDFQLEEGFSATTPIEVTPALLEGISPISDLPIHKGSDHAPL